MKRRDTHHNTFASPDICGLAPTTGTHVCIYLLCDGTPFAAKKRKTNDTTLVVYTAAQGLLAPFATSRRHKEARRLAFRRAVPTSLTAYHGQDHRHLAKRRELSSSRTMPPFARGGYYMATQYPHLKATSTRESRERNTGVISYAPLYKCSARAVWSQTKQLWTFFLLLAQWWPSSDPGTTLSPSGTNRRKGGVDIRPVGGKACSAEPNKNTQPDDIIL